MATRNDVTSPVQGYVSSHYGRRGGGFHAGLDIATGGKPGNVYAMFEGTVVKIVRGRKHGDRSRHNEIAPYRTGNGPIIQNPDGERQVYCHVNTTRSLKVGDKVKVGQYLGKTDLSGNTTGYHLHLEIWYANGKTRNPMIDFRYFGIKPGSKPNIYKAPKAPINSGSGGNKSVSASVKAALKVMGLPQNTSGVKAYQEAHGLYPDGNWGTVTRRYYHWVKLLQQYVNKWKRVQPKIRVDGYRGSVTRRAERQARAGAIPSVPYRPPAEPPKRP